MRNEKGHDRSPTRHASTARRKGPNGTNAAGREKKGSVPEYGTSSSRGVILCGAPRLIKGIPYDPRPLRRGFQLSELSLRDLGVSVGCTYQQVQNVIAGKNPTSPLIFPLCRLLGVDPATIWPERLPDLKSPVKKEADRE